MAYSTTGHRGGETRTCAWSKDIKRQLAFVSQDDIVIEGLTVRQSLSYTAQLRLPRAWSAARESSTRSGGARPIPGRPVLGRLILDARRGSAARNSPPRRSREDRARFEKAGKRIESAVTMAQRQAAGM